MNDKIFREYDIRGTYPTDINEDVAYKIGRSYGSYIRERYNQTKCIVSCDNRLSSDSLKENLIKGIRESGISVIDLGLTTTPINMYGRKLYALYGIMVTASHNPKDDNGFKFNFGTSANASGKDIENFKEYTFAGNFKTGNGDYTEVNIEGNYFNYLQTGLKFGENKVKVIVDPANGSTAPFLNNIFDKFNIDYTIINKESDGNFPAHHPDPADYKNLRQLQDEVIKTGASLGIAYDGDGDRIGFVNELGEVISVEDFMIIIIRDIFYKVNNRTFLFDVKCSKKLEDEIIKLGGTAHLSRTGASYTQQATHDNKIPFGGEASGHVYFKDRIEDCGSAIYASLRLIEILSKTDKSISDLLIGTNKYYTSEEIKITVTDENKFNIVNKVKVHCKEKGFVINELDGVKAFFKEGWVLVRASNTGPNLILRAEANTLEHKEKLENYFKNLINSSK